MRGAGKLLADTLATARRAGAGGPDGAGVVLVRADSTFYGYDIVDTCRRAGARLPITACQTPAVSRAIAAIADEEWTPIRYRHAVYDDQAQRWVSDAEVAEVGFTAFPGRRQAEHVTARLIVRRVRRLNPHHRGPGAGHIAGRVPAEQGELFAAYRYHAVFTDSGEPTLTAEATHRDHAIVEQVIADLNDSALAHLPSGHFAANGAWLALAAIAHNLTCAAGAFATTFHAPARTGTLRAQLIRTPARLTRSAHRRMLHLPQHWPWQTGLDELFRRALHDPLPAAA